MIWVVRWQFDVLWWDRTFRVRLEDAMCVWNVDLRVKRLSFRTLTPINAVKRLLTLEVKIGFSGSLVGRSWAIAGKITGFSEAVSDEFHIRP